MMIPRFTIRTLLTTLTICAVLFVIAGMAYRGQHWAWGVTIAILSLGVMAVVHAAWFGLVWMFARPRSPREKPAPHLD
jgi:hypothetical protein